MNVQEKPKGSRERTLDEVKTEFMRRAGKLNPFEDIKPEDAAKVMAALKSLDKDHWADEWCKIGLAYEDKADALAKTDGSRETLRELYMHGFDACRVGRYPSPVSPGKLVAYHYSLRMFRASRLALMEYRARFPEYAREIDAQLQDFRHWFAWGRRRRLEGRSAEDRGGDHESRSRLAHHRHAGQRRKPRAVRRSGRRADLFGVA